MATDKTDYLEQLFLQLVFSQGNYTGGNLYLALFTAKPDEDMGFGAEVSGNNYARQQITFDVPAQSGPGSWSCPSLGTVVFPTASANWGTIVAVGIADAVSGGNMLYLGNVTPLAVNSGDQAAFTQGSIEIGESGKSDFLCQALLEAFLRGNSYFGATVELALFNTVPASDDSGGVEVPTGSGYGRYTMNFDNILYVGAALNAGYRATFGEDFIFATRTGPSPDWGTITGWGLYSSGNLIYTANFGSPFMVPDGRSVLFQAGSLAVEEV